MQSFDFQQLLIFHLNQLAFRWEPVLWVGLPLLIPAAGLLYVWQRYCLTNVPASLCAVLTGLRVFILAALIFRLADPFLRPPPAPAPRPVFAVLLDHSQSMEFPAGPFDTDADLAKAAAAAGYPAKDGATDPETRKALNRIGRSKLAQTALTHAIVTGEDGKPKPFTEALSEKFDVRYYSFSSDLKQFGVNPSNPQLPDPPHPGGNSTQIGDALHTLHETVGARLAGVLVFSDGQNTAGRALTGRAGEGPAYGDAKVPIYAVPVGPTRQLQDVAVVGVDAPSTVSVGDTVSVAATIESRGFDERVVKVQLWEGDKQVLENGDKNKPVEKELTLSAAEQQHVDLTFKAVRVGAHYLTVKVPPQPEEPEYLQRNNSDAAFVRVTDEKIKVLFLEGLPRWDYRFLKNAMRRDNGLSGRADKEPDVVLEAEWRRLSDKERQDALPRTLDQLAEYHTIILGDVSPKMLDAAFVKLLVRAVQERGVGLVIEAGPLSMPHEFDDRLDAVLPVRLKRGAPGQMPQHGESFLIQLAPEGMLHDAMRLFDDPTENQNGWAQMPRYFWCAAAEKAVPGATVLAWNPVESPAGGKTPLIVQSYAGKGQVLFVGTDSTWLWRQNVGDRFFYKFWGQAIRAVARNDKTMSKKSSLEVQPIHVQVGEPARVELTAFAADGSPRIDATLTVQSQSGGEVGSIPMSADVSVKGRYTGLFTPKNVGEYRLSYAGDGGVTAETVLPVTAAPDEGKHPNLNRAALEKLAGDSHGRIVELYDLASLDKELKPSPPPEHREEASEQKSNPWDAAVLAILIALAYSVDVGLRRLRGLS